MQTKIQQQVDNNFLLVSVEKKILLLYKYL